jgi:signal peptide peptidase-like 2B
MMDLEVGVVGVWFVSLLVVFGGAWWGASYERALNVHRHQPIADSPIESPPEQPTFHLDIRFAMLFTIVASAVLIVLFYFIEYLIYVLLVMFAMLSMCAMVACGTAFFEQFTCCAKLASSRCEGSIRGRGRTSIAWLQLLLLVPSFAIVIWWFIDRKEMSYIWAVHDFMAACVLLLIQRHLKLPNIKVASVLLGAAFCYDIFWVFASPYFFKHSVMMHVATGGDSGEIIPMVMYFPSFLSDGGFYLIGLGDIALPGLLCTLLLRYDYIKGHSWRESYFTVSLIGYIIGLIIAYVVLALTNTGQPALLYIVPTTLGTTLLLAHCRAQLDELTHDLVPATHPIVTTTTTSTTP